MTHRFYCVKCKRDYWSEEYDAKCPYCDRYTNLRRFNSDEITAEQMATLKNLIGQGFTVDEILKAAKECLGL